jgi:hypothetical protein
MNFNVESNQHDRVNNMNSFTRNEIDAILSDIKSEEISSNLGYFSKPFRVSRENRTCFIKLYLPVKDPGFVSSIINNHDEYLTELKYAGLKIPETVIVSRQKGKKHQLVIIQDSFRDDELLRNRIIEAGITELTNLCAQVFDDIIQFWNRKKKSTNIGFHPTLRNYALHEGNLYFFDTFPPMLMSQRKLNAIILRMSPYGGWLRKLTPLSIINKISDEYYHLDKMLAGIVGSCCRLRPDDALKILAFSRDYITAIASLSDSEKESILMLLKETPQLSKIWILIRKLSGNVGKPNINTPTSS